MLKMFCWIYCNIIYSRCMGFHSEHATWSGHHQMSSSLDDQRQRPGRCPWCVAQLCWVKNEDRTDMNRRQLMFFDVLNPLLSMIRFLWYPILARSRSHSLVSSSGRNTFFSKLIWHPSLINLGPLQKRGKSQSYRNSGKDW